MDPASEETWELTRGHNCMEVDDKTIYFSRRLISISNHRSFMNVNTVQHWDLRRSWEFKLTKCFHLILFLWVNLYSNWFINSQDQIVFPRPSKQLCANLASGHHDVVFAGMYLAQVVWSRLGWKLSICLLKAEIVHHVPFVGTSLTFLHSYWLCEENFKNQCHLSTLKLEKYFHCSGRCLVWLQSETWSCTTMSSGTSVLPSASYNPG